MKVLDWLCGCDAPNRDESAAYLADTTNAGDLPQKKPVVLCTDQPRSDCPVAPLKTQLQATLEGKEIKKGNDSTGVRETSKTDIKFPLPEQRETMKPLSVITFSSVEHNVNAYRELCRNVNNVLDDRVRRMEAVLEDETGLPEEVEGDIRLARGKMMVIMKNNLTKFGKLADVAEDTEQGISDLTGFWGLVHTELEDIKRACGRVEAARLNAWQAVPRSSPPTSRTPAMKRVQTANKSGTTTPTNRTPKPTPKTNPKLREFMAQKRKEMQDNLVSGEPQTVA